MTWQEVRNKITAHVHLIDRAGYAPRHASEGKLPDVPALAHLASLTPERVRAVLLQDYDDDAITEPA